MSRSFTTSLALAAALVAACNRPGELPDLGVTEYAVAFEAPGSSGDPAPRTIYAVNTGRGSLGPPAAELAYLDAEGWLTVTVSGRGAPYAVELRATTGGMRPGTYRALLTLDCPDPSASAVVVPVKLMVPGPSYAPSTSTLAFEAPALGGDPVAQVFQVVNGGRGTLPTPEVEVSYVGTTGWLTATVSGAPNAFAVMVSASELPGMASGTHTATLSIGSVALGDPRREVTVSFTLPAQLELTASLVPFVPAPGDSGPLTQTFTVRNVGRGVLAPPTATATSVSGWLSAEVTGAADPYTVVVTADRYRALAAGDYVGTVGVTSSAARTTPTTDVSLKVGPPAMAVSGAASWSVYAGCPLPDTSTVGVTNAGVGLLPRPAVTIPAEAAGWLGAEALGANAPYRVVFSVIAPPPVAAGGSISTAVVLSATGADPVSVPVTYAAPAPAITRTRASPNPLVIHAQAGTGSPAPGVLSVQTDGGCIPTPRLSYAFAPGEIPWLAWRASTEVQRHQVFLQPNTAVVPAGTRRDLDLLVSSTRPGEYFPLYEEHVTLTLENATIAPTGPLSVARHHHAAVLLPDGRVLVTGGQSGFDWLTSAEVYDPVRGRFDPYPSLLSARAGHGAVVLDDGSVVVCGPSTCERSSGGPWTPLADLQLGHELARVVQLSAGRLLVVSGRAANLADSPAPVEVVELGTGIASFVTLDGAERLRASGAVKLLDGRTLVTGGPAGASWLYDPETDLWTPTGNLTTVRFEPALAPLPDGRVYAVSGWYWADPGYGAAEGAEIWNPATGAWSRTGPRWLNNEAGDRVYHVRPENLALAASGRVLAINADRWSENPAAEIMQFDPATETWSTVGATALPDGRMWGTVTVMPGHKILIVGGARGDTDKQSTAEAFTW